MAATAAAETVTTVSAESKIFAFCVFTFMWAHGQINGTSICLGCLRVCSTIILFLFFIFDWMIRCVTTYDVCLMKHLTVCAIDRDRVREEGRESLGAFVCCDAISRWSLKWKWDEWRSDEQRSTLIESTKRITVCVLGAICHFTNKYNIVHLCVAANGRLACIPTHFIVWIWTIFDKIKFSKFVSQSNG